MAPSNPVEKPDTPTETAIHVPPHHWHCPCACEHPQPFVVLSSVGVSAVGRSYCGRCFHEGQTFCEMLLCTRETCPGDTAS